MAKSSQSEVVEETTPAPRKRRAGRRRLPSDPSQGFIQLVTGPTGRMQRCLDAIESLGKVSYATVPTGEKTASGADVRVPVEYDTEAHVDAIEATLMEALENAINLLRNRPPTAKAATAGFTFK